MVSGLEHGVLHTEAFLTTRPSLTWQNKSTSHLIHVSLIQS